MCTLLICVFLKPPVIVRVTVRYEGYKCLLPCVIQRLQSQMTNRTVVSCVKVANTKQYLHVRHTVPASCARLNKGSISAHFLKLYRCSWGNLIYCVCNWSKKNISVLTLIFLHWMWWTVLFYSSGNSDTVKGVQCTLQEDLVGQAETGSTVFTGWPGTCFTLHSCIPRSDHSWFAGFFIAPCRHAASCWHSVLCLYE